MNDFQPFAVGVKFRVEGKVLKVVRRSEALRLVIDLSAIPGRFSVVFANFNTDVFKANKMRKDKPVTVEGKVVSYGAVSYTHLTLPTSDLV